MYRILQPGDEGALEAFLLPRLASSMFLLGNMRMSGLTDGATRAHGVYAAAFDGDASGDKIVGVVAHYWNGNLLTQSPPAQLDTLWRLAAATSGRPIRGVLGPAAQAFAVLDGLSVTPARVKLASEERLYALSLQNVVVPDILARGAVAARRITADDVALLAEWRTAYSVESLGEEDSALLHAENLQAIQRQQRAGDCWVVEVNGQPVAMSAFNARLPEAVQIGGVYTPPALRGRGYARAAVAQSLLDTQAEGVGTAILFTDLENVAAQRAYAALGFRVVGDYAIILLH